MTDNTQIISVLIGGALAIAGGLGAQWIVHLRENGRLKREKLEEIFAATQEVEEGMREQLQTLYLACQKRSLERDERNPKSPLLPVRRLQVLVNCYHPSLKIEAAELEREVEGFNRAVFEINRVASNPANPIPSLDEASRKVQEVAKLSSRVREKVCEIGRKL